MSLVNVAYSASLTWVDPHRKTLDAQALVPMYGTHPVELGLREGDRFLDTLRSDARYRDLFERAFPDTADRFTIAIVTRAIACFERTIISGRSPWDRYHYNREDDAISAAAQRGEVLFFSQPLSCFRCHGGFKFSSAELRNTGDGTFKVPTLRNIAVTAPYMHDGSIATLEAVVDHYASGGRGGRENRGKDPPISGFSLSPRDRADLVEFLKSLTDEAVLHDPRFANPW
jgi:cytochrome c peroxidase